MQSQQALTFLKSILEREQVVLTDIQTAIFCACWEDQSYRQVADERGYEYQYIKKVGAQLWKTLSQSLKTKVSKRNVQSILKLLYQENTYEIVVPLSPVVSCDWGTSGSLSKVWGRDKEFKQLQELILTEQCNLIAILGTGGVGKTSFAIKAAQQMQSDFHAVIWRTVRDAPPPTEFLGDLLQFFTKDQDLPLPTQLNEQIVALVQILQTSRCLIIIDNFESLLTVGNNCGQYRQDYLGYKTLLNCMSDSQHQSCCVITSREMPENIGILSGELLPVRQLVLSGLEAPSVKKIIGPKNLIGNDTDILKLTQRMSGNPLAIKLASTSIQDIFSGYISEFLEQESLAFNGIKLLIQQQINRLSPLELQVMYWLALNREVITTSELEGDFLEVESKAKLLEALEHLSHRYLIEKVNRSQNQSRPTGFTLQPVVMEYVTDQCLQGFCTEIITGQLNLLRQYSLCKPFGKEYIDRAQKAIFIRPLLQKISVHFSSTQNLKEHLKGLLLAQQKCSPLQTGYSAGNLINILFQLQDSFKTLDLSRLYIKNGDFRGIKLHGVTLKQSDVSSCRFSENLGSIFSIAYSPNGQLLAFGDSTQIKLYRVSDYRLQLTLTGHQAPPLWAIAFLGNTLLASASGDRSIKIWDLATGQCRTTLDPDQGMVYKLAFCPQMRASPLSSPPTWQALDQMGP